MQKPNDIGSLEARDVWHVGGGISSQCYHADPHVGFFLRSLQRKDHWGIHFLKGDPNQKGICLLAVRGIRNNYQNLVPSKYGWIW